MSLVEKKMSELTAADIQELYKPIGTPDMPYPGIISELDSEGNVVKMKLGVIADPQSRLAFYTDQSQDFVTGLLFRNMASPSLLFAQQEIIRQMAPDSNNRLVVLLGEPGNGKTEMAKTIAWASDSRGPLIVDCGGRYMSDLIWEKVIDYGEGFKTALTDRIRNGTLSAKSIEIFDQSLPGALVRENGKITNIDWDKIGEPKGTAEKPESTAEATERDMKLIKQIAEFEGIPPEATNSIGIKKQHGIAVRAFQEGRKLILDEITKSKVDGDDALQTWFQFVNGEIPEVTLQNDLKVAGHPETDDITLRRADMKVGFGVIATGNEESDGVSTHGFSVSQNSRFIIYKSGKPGFDDWKHQICREMTGMPFSTINLVLPGAGQNDPEGFGDALVQTCLLGLQEQNRTKVTPEQLTHLKNWENTNDAVDMMTKFYMFFKQLVDPTSELNSRGLDKEHVDYDIMEALKGEAKSTMAFRDQCAIDPRKIIQDVTNATKIKPAVQTIEESASLSLNPSAIGHRSLTPPTNNPEEISAGFGTRMAQVLLARVGSMMVGRDALNAALVTKMKQIGILPSEQHPPGETLADLLNQELIPNLGGTRNEFYFRKILIEHLKTTNPGLALKTDDEIVQEDQAADAYKELARLSAESAETKPREARIILLGQDLSNIFNLASAVDSIGNKNQPAPANLIPASAFLESLKVPALADLNTQAIFRTTVSAENLIPPSDVTTPVIQIAENTGDSGIGITTLMMQGADGTAVPVHFMHDGLRGTDLIVTDKVDDATKAALNQDGITVVGYGDSDAGMRVADFIRETLEQTSRAFSVKKIEPQLTAAFMLRAGDATNEAKLQPLKDLMTTRNLPALAAVNMINKRL